MALACLLDLADRYSDRKGRWTYEGEKVDDSFFTDAMQEYCYSFYSIGTSSSMEAFLGLSQKMLQLYPDNTGFLSNIGSYHMLANGDYKTALKYYSKVLKKKPDDYTAIKNSALAARKLNNRKLEIKYLRMLVEHGPEKEKIVAESRLKALENK